VSSRLELLASKVLISGTNRLNVVNYYTYLQYNPSYLHQQLYKSIKLMYMYYYSFVLYTSNILPCKCVFKNLIVVNHMIIS